jgi:glycogen debranching enzyme
MQTIKKAAQAVAQALPSKPESISLPKTNANSLDNGIATRTPRTPADEAIAFFSGTETSKDGSLLQVWELSLEDDGGPSYEKSVSRTFV